MTGVTILLPLSYLSYIVGDEFMTQKLYEIDSYCREFKAVVESCESDGEYYYIVLDNISCFLVKH